jgi:cytochrome c2
MKFDKKFKQESILIAFFIALSIYSFFPFLSSNSWATEGGPKQGWKTFYQKGCLNCHTIWGMGGSRGIELTGISLNSLSLEGLVAKHKKHVLQRGINIRYRQTPLTFKFMGEEILDLISFLKFIQTLDGPGNPSRGKRILLEKQCNSCHSKIAPDLAQKAKFANPVSWITQMWNHAPRMGEAMSKKNIAWPRFSDHDLMDLMAYISRLRPGIKKVYLVPGDPREGEKVVKTSICLTCHSISGKGGKVGPEFTILNKVNKKPPRTFGQLATLMWNHFPEMYQAMSQRGLKPPVFSEKDMINLTAYLFSLQKNNQP